MTRSVLAARAALAVASLIGLSGWTPPPALEPYIVFQTEQGPIAIVLKVREAPATACNFLRYVRAHRYDGGTIFRTVVAETNDNPNPIDVIQAATTGGDDDPGFGPIKLERTRDTGLKHVAGAVSMARDGPDTATSSFFIVVRDAPALDYGGRRNPDGQGFAVFGEVTSGTMDLVRSIHAAPARDEKLVAPVTIRWASAMTDVPECPR